MFLRITVSVISVTNSMKKMKAINPVIATLFLVIAAVIVGVAVIGWTQGWFTSTARTVDLQITGEIVRTSTASQLNLQIKNVGTVKVRIQKISVETEDSFTPDFGTPNVHLGGFLSSWSDAGSTAGEIIISGTQDLNPGDIVSGYIKADSADAWKSGAKYIITIVFQDVDRGTTLTKTVTVQA